MISPYVDRQVNPNSYNYRLGPVILGMDDGGQRVAFERDLSESDLVLRPGRVYLGHTAETIGSDRYVTLLNGRSSMGRLGIFLNFSADLGQLGPPHQWTLEIKVVQPVRVYAGMQVGQASFWLPQGRIVEYVGEYARRSLPTPSLHDLRTRG